MDTTEMFYAEDANYRVRVVRDEYPDEPYNDGGSPILTYECSGSWHADQVTGITNHRVDDQIIEALARWSNRGENFERYMRIFHGTTEIKWYDSGKMRYVSFDTADWRADMGMTDEWVAQHAGHGIVDVSEWRAYCEGEVYGHVIERRVEWTREGSDPVETMVTWEEIDSCWGYYGSEYAEWCAREALAEFTASNLGDKS